MLRKSAKILASTPNISQHLPSSILKMSSVVAERAQGSWVWDTEGNRYLDFSSGIGVTSTGHCHPKVVAAAQKQMATFIHAQQNIFGTHTAQVELVNRLLKICPKELTKFFFANSGSEAIDNVIKIARAATKKTNIIAFQGGFHGRTIGALSITTSKVFYRQGFQPLMSGVITAPYPYCARCPVRCAAGPKLSATQDKTASCCQQPLKQLELIFKTQSAPNETAAIIVEPILGEGGILTPPTGFLNALRDICDKHKILLVYDEVQSGVARSGKWWAYEHWANKAPDMLVFAKGIASGFPMAGIATTSEVMNKTEPGTLGGTYGANAVACAAASATIDVIEEEKILDNAHARGQEIIEGLGKMARKYPAIQDIRGAGLMIGVELDDSTYGVAGAVSKAAYKNGLLLLTAGPHETFRILPSLNITKDEVQDGLQRLDKSLQEVFQK